MKTYLATMKVTIISAVIVGSALIAQAVPTPINGTISFSGSATADGTSFLTATQFLSFQEVFVGASLSVSGDYLGTSGAAATVTPFIWDPTTASTPITDLWWFQHDGITYSYDLEALQVDFIATDALVLSGIGTAFITGPGIERLPTTGKWNFSAQAQNLATFTFSSSTTATPTRVPDGGSTVALLGGVLIGLRKITRRKTSSKRA